MNNEERREHVNALERANRKRLRENPEYREKIKEQRRAWRAANVESLRASKVAWNKENADKIKEQRKVWREANADRIREQGREWSKAWREANPGKVTERVRAWRKANPERTRSLARALREANIDSVKEYQREWGKAWRAKNPGRANENARKRRETLGKDMCNEIARAWRMANLERSKSNQRAWRMANPERCKETTLQSQIRRRARIVENGFEEIVQEDAMKLWEAYPLCPYCNKRESTTLDHIVPVARGGAHTLANLVPCCKSCNSSKNANSLEVFAARRNIDIAAFWSKRMSVDAVIDESVAA